MKLFPRQTFEAPAHVLLVGTGLMGGSLALALKQRWPSIKMTGVGRHLDVLQTARSLGMIDAAVLPHRPGYEEAVAQADLLILAMPVGQTAAVLRDALPFLRTDALITDLGSTKMSVYHDACEVLEGRIGQFVLAHPIAGRELNGPQAALADLYQGKKTMLCPLPQNRAKDVAYVAGMWQAVGAQVHQLSLAEHDAIFVAVSHVPHVLAYALMNHVSATPLSNDKFALAGAGFRDFTRIAAAQPEMWRDICVANREAIAHELDAYLARLSQLRTQIHEGDGEALLQAFTQASQQRLAWGEKH